jgi:hypothetical protein
MFVSQDTQQGQTENACNAKLAVIGPVTQKIFLNVSKLDFKW